MLKQHKRMLTVANADYKKISKLVYTQALFVDVTTFGKMFTSTLLIRNILCRQFTLLFDLIIQILP